MKVFRLREIAQQLWYHLLPGCFFFIFNLEYVSILFERKLKNTFTTPCNGLALLHLQSEQAKVVVCIYGVNFMQTSTTERMKFWLLSNRNYGVILSIHFPSKRPCNTRLCPSLRFCVYFLFCTPVCTCN